MRLFAKFLFGAVLALASGPALAADPALEAMVEKGVDACLANRTKTFKAQAGLEQAGWRSEGSTGKIRLYFADRYRAVAITSPSYDKDNVCGFGIKDMNAPEAAKLADRIMRQKFGEGIERGTKQDLEPGEAALFGVKKGNEVTVAVVRRDVNYSPYYRGSLIFFSFYNAK